MKKRMAGWRRMAAGFGAVFLAVSPAFQGTVLAKPSDVEEVKQVWDFSDGTQGWVYDDSWAGDGYHGTGTCEQDPEKEMLKVSLDYSADVENGWSQTGISLTDSAGIDYSPYKVLTFELYYDPNAYTTGQIAVKAYSDNVFQDQISNMNQGVVSDVDGLKMVTLSMVCDAGYAQSEKPETLMLIIIGNNTDYKGNIWIDNIKLSNIKEEKYLVDSTVIPDTRTDVSSTETALTVNGTVYPYVDSVQVADPDADPCVTALYQYLKAVGESEGILFGHMEDTVLMLYCFLPW